MDELAVDDELIEFMPTVDKRKNRGTLHVDLETYNDSISKYYPLLGTRIYNVEFPDGGVAEYSTNVIIESLIENSNEYFHVTEFFPCEIILFHFEYFTFNYIRNFPYKEEKVDLYVQYSYWV